MPRRSLASLATVRGPAREGTTYRHAWPLKVGHRRALVGGTLGRWVVPRRRAGEVCKATLPTVSCRLIESNRRKAFAESCGHTSTPIYL